MAGQSQKKGINHKAYTLKELKLILETPDKNMKDLAFLLNRTTDALRRKKWALLHSERDKVAKLLYKKKQLKDSKKNAGYDNTRWSVAEEKEVLESKLTDKELAVKLGRTIAAVQMKRLRLLRQKEE